MNAHHSSESSEWQTPVEYIEAARTAMGRIDVDPASSADANVFVAATRFYSEEKSGLVPGANWCGNVFLNPPGGLVWYYWWRLRKEYENGRVRQAVWIGYSLQQLQTLQNDGGQSGQGPISVATALCFPRKRIAFIDPKTRLPRKSPTHANYVAYLGNDAKRFVDAFSEFGESVLNVPYFQWRHDA